MFSFSVWGDVHSPQLTKGRPKPKKASRRDAGERLGEARTVRTLAGPPRVQMSGSPAQSVIAKAAIMPTPLTRSTPTAARAIDTASHADEPMQLSSRPPTSKRDTDRWNGQGLIGVGSSDSTPSKPRDVPSPVGLAQPLPGPSIPSPPSPLRSQAQPSPRPPRRQSRIPSTGSRTLVMDVAQALQEAQASTTEVEAASKSSPPLVAQRQAEFHAPPIEKRKSSFDKYSSRLMTPLAEGRSATIRGVNPKPSVHWQTEVEINAEVRAQERGSPDDILPVQQGDSFIEIRE